MGKEYLPPLGKGCGKREDVIPELWEPQWQEPESQYRK